MKLTRTQNEMLNILSYDEYRDIQAFRFHSAGNTIKALRAKGLIETRYIANLRATYKSTEIHIKSKQSYIKNNVNTIG
jgi:quinol monooxygenase YgiN